MYLVVFAWLYVVLMMSVVEATGSNGSNGSILGAIVTFFLYGLVPLSLVVYLMLAPQRKRALREREAAEERERHLGLAQGHSPLPDTGGHATGAAEPGGIAPMGKEP
jgi:hypothetical protein